MTKTIFQKKEMGHFLEKHDMIYEKPAPSWESGLPLANSTVSAMIWGSSSLNISLDRADIWETRRFHPDGKKYTWSRFKDMLDRQCMDDIGAFCMSGGPCPQHIPVGRLEIRGKGRKILKYYMRLSLYDATAYGSFETECGSISWRCYVSASTSSAIVFHYETSGEESICDIRLRLISKLGDYSEEYKHAINKTPWRMRMRFVEGYPNGIPEFAQVLKDWGYPDPQFGTEGNYVFAQQTIPENGDYAVSWTQLNSSETKGTILISIIADRIHGHAKAKSFEVLERMRDCAVLTRDEEAHRLWWHEYYPKSFLSFPDRDLPAYNAPLAC